MTYEKQHDWEKVDEKKGWKTENMPSDMYKVKISENEVNQGKHRWFNFTIEQKDSDRWKKHVDQWVERLKKVNNL